MPFNWTSELSLTIDQIHAIFIGFLIKVPTGVRHDANIELVREALETPRLHEHINGPWKTTLHLVRHCLVQSC